MTPQGSPAREVMRRAVLAAVAGVVVVGAVAAQVFIVSPLRKTGNAIDAAAKAVDGLEQQLSSNERVLRALRDRASTTLGATVDEASHQFRTRLSGLAETSGMTRIVVDQKSGEATLNPLVSAKGVPQALLAVRTKLRKEADFTLLRGTLRAQGTLEHALGLIAAVQAQGWVHRVEGFSIKPVGRERASVEVTLDVTSLFVPDLVGKGYEQPAMDPVAPGSDVLAQRVVSRDPFRFAPKEEPAVAVAVAPPVPAPAVPVAPVPPAYHEWRVVGVMMGSRGSEAILVNTRTGESRTLEVGQEVLNARLVGCRDELAIFEIEQGRFVVPSGGTLADRRPEEPVHSSG